MIITKNAQPRGGVARRTLARLLPVSHVNNADRVHRIITGCGNRLFKHHARHHNRRAAIGSNGLQPSALRFDAVAVVDYKGMGNGING